MILRRADRRRPNGCREVAFLSMDVDGAASLEPELARLRELALAAGAMLLAEHGRARDIAFKSPTDMVTDLDRAVEARLLQGLARDFPGDAVVAEEGGAQGGRSGRTWYVDPLDGTTNFVHGHPCYCVSLGCARDDQLLLAAVHAPYLDELYLARRGGGAILERPRAGRRLVLPRRAEATLAAALLSTGFPYQRDALVTRTARLMERFLLAGCHGVRRGGSAALDLCHVAAGALDGHWEMRLHPWDVAAGTLIAREAGALVTDFSGRGGLLTGWSVLAAAPGLHAELLAVLAEESVDAG